MSVDMNELVKEVVREYVNALKELRVDMDYEEDSGIVKVPVPPANPIPKSVLMAMAPILRERLLNREVLFEGFIGAEYVRTRARIVDVAYEETEPIFMSRMGGFVFTLESIEQQPRTFEVHMALNGEISAINLLNSALLIHNNPWLTEEIANAAKEASDRLSATSDIIVKAYAALKLLGFQ